MTPRTAAGERLASWEAKRAQFQGLGILQPLLDEPGLTDIYVNGPREIWTDGVDGIRRTDLRFPDEESVRALAVRVIAAEGRRLDSGHPCADVQTAAGYRIHAVLPPIASDHTHLSIRRQPEARPSFDDLEQSGMFTAEIGDVIRVLVARRRSLLISGSTGSGKTTLLNAVVELCPGTERLVLLEDSAELLPAHPHVVSLRTRHPNAEGAGAVTLTDLIREALRMGPDRLFLGECRGAEIKDYFLAMNTGHEGGGATVHANSAAAVPSRLMALGTLAGLSPEAVARQAQEAIDVVLHVARSATTRWIQQIGVIAEADGRLGLRIAAEFDSDGVARRGAAWPELEALSGRTEDNGPLSGPGNPGMRRNPRGGRGEP